jgi:hypothetical protein
MGNVIGVTGIQPRMSLLAATITSSVQLAQFLFLSCVHTSADIFIRFSLASLTLYVSSMIVLPEATRTAVVVMTKGMMEGKHYVPGTCSSSALRSHVVITSVCVLGENERDVGDRGIWRILLNIVLLWE